MSITEILIIIIFAIIAIGLLVAIIWVLFNQKNKKTTTVEPISDNTQALNASITEIITKVDSISTVFLKDIRDQLNPISNIQLDLSKINNIFLNSKQRGNFGEIQLETILTNILGMESNNIWQSQVKLLNGKMIDIIVNMGDKKIAIDSKFPLENYTSIVNTTKKDELEFYRKQFANDVKAKIDEASRYISVKDNIDSVIVFIPSENVFTEIAGDSSLLEYASSRKVLLSSPTNIALAIMTIKEYDRKFRLYKDMEKNLLRIERLSEEFERWKDRWIKHVKLIKDLDQNSRDLSTTTEKIIKKFDDIHDSEFGHENETFNQ